MLCFVLVLDPRGEVDVGEGELEDCEKKKQEMSSPSQVRQHIVISSLCGVISCGSTHL